MLMSLNCDDSDDGTFDGTHFQKWSQLFMEASIKTGKDPRWPARYGEWMVEAGFEGVTEKVSIVFGFARQTSPRKTPF